MRAAVNEYGREEGTGKQDNAYLRRIRWQLGTLNP
jgi:hypothetical protein